MIFLSGQQSQKTLSKIAAGHGENLGFLFFFAQRIQHT
jgi:hypothetical protein